MWRGTSKEISNTAIEELASRPIVSLFLLDANPIWNTLMDLCMTWGDEMSPFTLRNNIAKMAQCHI